MIRALLVDDDVGPLEAIRAVFEMHGFEVVLSNDGKSALYQALQLGPDIVMTDFEMPHLDGVGLCQALRCHPRFREVPLILTSGKSPPAGRHLWDAFLKKPVDFEILDELLSRAKRRLKG